MAAAVDPSLSAHEDSTCWSHRNISISYLACYSPHLIQFSRLFRPPCSCSVQDHSLSCSVGSWQPVPVWAWHFAHLSHPTPHPIDSNCCCPWAPRHYPTLACIVSTVTRGHRCWPRCHETKGPTIWSISHRCDWNWGRNGFGLRQVYSLDIKSHTVPSPDCAVSGRGVYPGSGCARGPKSVRKF